jgi:hypothetical protein
MLSFLHRVLVIPMGIETGEVPDVAHFWSRRFRA